MDIKGKFFTDTNTHGSASLSATELLKAVNKLHNDVSNPVTGQYPDPVLSVVADIRCNIAYY